MKTLLSAELVVAIALSAGAVVSANEVGVARYDVFEVELTSSKTYANPFLDVTVRATFTAPSGREVAAYGFHDGGTTWRVRIAPDEVGVWRYLTQASDTADGGLDNRSGAFRCVRSSNKGFVRVDPKRPYSFSYSDGTPFFALGDTCTVTSKALSDANRKSYLDARARKPFNFLRMFASLTFNAWTGKPWGEAIARDADGFPWGGTPQSPDYDRLNPAYFQRYEKILGELKQRDVHAEIIVFNLYEVPFKDPAVWTRVREELWGRYVVARLSAYRTVFLWTVAQEYERYPLGRYRHEPADDDWVRRMAQLIREADPYGHPITVHPVGDGGKPGEVAEVLMAGGVMGTRFGQGSELDVLSHQHNSYGTATWVPDPAPGYWDGPGAGVEKAVWADRQFGKPVINTEYGYEWLQGGDVNFNQQTHGTDKCRRAAWRIFTAGGAGLAAGFRGTTLSVDKAEIYYDKQQRFAPFHVADSGHVRHLQHLYDFVTLRTGFRDMNPAQALVNAPNLCLANPGKEYVVYAPNGGALSLDLTEASGSFSVAWLNPRTGAYGGRPWVSGGAPRTFSTPGTVEGVLGVAGVPPAGAEGLRPSMRRRDAFDTRGQDARDTDDWVLHLKAVDDRSRADWQQRLERATRTPESWRSRREEIRRQILVSAGLWPEFKRPPVKPVVTGQIERDGYTLQKVYLETWPGFYLTGVLYLPRDRPAAPAAQPVVSRASRPRVPRASGPRFEGGTPSTHAGKACPELAEGMPATQRALQPLDDPTVSSPVPQTPGLRPAVLCTHGHGKNGRFGPSEEQPRAITLARLGFVVFAYDMIGYGECTQLPHEFADPPWGINLLGLQLWNSLCVVDFVSSLPQVDPKRIGVTGSSGGGTQTFLLTAVDDRIACAAPVCMVAAEFQGGCSCENAPGLRIGLNNVEIAAATAPRPLLLVAATGDWTKYNPILEGPAIHGVYQALGVADRFRCVQFAAPHNYNQDSREAVYPWFAHWLGQARGTGILPVDNMGGTPMPRERLAEPALEAESHENLEVFTQAHPRPKNAVDAAGLTALLHEKIRQQLDALWPQDAAALERFRQTMAPALRYTLSAKWPGSDEIEVTTAETVARAGSFSKVSVRHRGLPAPGPQGRSASGIELLTSTPAGEKRCASLLVAATDQEMESTLQELRRGKASPVREGVQSTPYLLRLRPHEPEIASGGTEQQRRQYVSTYYRTALAWQVQDVLTALAYLTERAGFSEVRLAGLGEAGIPTLLARALEPTGKVSTTIADLAGLDGQDEKTWTGARAQPGILRLGGLRTAAILAAPGELILHNTSAHLDVTPIRAAYRVAGRTSALEISESPWTVSTILERVGAATAADGAVFSADFFKLCDRACRELNAPTRKVPFYNDSYAVRALAVAYDLTQEERYLDVCRAWSDRMIGFQEKMIPAGAYYMNYGRKPGEDKGGWYVADSSSIALGILATAVRCADPAQKDRYLSSVKSFAKLVREDYVGPGGGICNGLWPRYAGSWWCCSGIFGSLMFLLHEETGDPQYLEVGQGAIDWLNRLDLEQAGPMTFQEMGATMPMYVLEAYSAAWPYLKPGSNRWQGAIAQMSKSLDWMAKNQVGRDNKLPMDYNSQWASKMGGLPFHMLVYARQVPGDEALVPAADQELRHIVQVLATGPDTGLPQLAVFGMMSLAERVSPGTIYRNSKAGSTP